MITKIVNYFILFGYKAIRFLAMSYRLFLRILRRADLLMGKYSPCSKAIDWLPLPRGIGYFLPEDVNVKTLFERLNSRGVRYVVLRWFEGLPNVESNGDIDILIHNNDIRLIKGLFTARVTNTAFDIYTVSACYGFTYKNLPYYPPYLAVEIIKSRRCNKNGIYVPSQKDYFFSLAYHALYHKGDSTILESTKNSAINKESKYVTKLKELSCEVGFQQEFSFVALDLFLAKNGWRPPFDTFRRIAHGNPRLKKYLLEIKEDIIPDLMVFVVRDSAMERGQLNVIINKIEKASLEIFYKCEVNDEKRSSVEQSIRGGEWGKEDFPYACLGGEPAFIIVVIDRAPEKFPLEQRAQYPFVTNKHSLLKHQIRNQLNEERICGQWTNMIHCSDDIYEALDYIEMSCPEIINSLLEQFPSFEPFWKDIRDRNDISGVLDKVV